VNAAPVVDASPAATASPVLTTDDIVQINQLVSAYGYMADTRDIDPSQVFTEDGVLDMTELNVGRREHMGVPQYGKPKPGPTEQAGRYALQHLMTSAYVYVEDGQVKGRSKWVVPLNTGTWTGGEYFDTYVKTPAGWRIKERKLVPRWGDFEDIVRARMKKEKKN
jgi:hypothetical protein